MMSKWTGDADGAFYSSEKFDQGRVVNLPEYEYNKHLSKSSYYVLGVDVGRIGLKVSSIKISLIAGKSKYIK